MSVTSTANINYDNHILLSVFDIARDWSVELASDITDYYVEDNTPVQDHIALKPKIITISGYQGELVTKTTNSISGFGLSSIKENQIVAGIQSNIKNVNLQKLVQKIDVLNPLNSILPPQVAQTRNKISQAADAFEKYRSIINQDYNTAEKIYNSAKQALTSSSTTKTISNYPESLNMERQKFIFTKFSYLWKQKKLCFVDTPWGTFYDMAIQSISVNQDEETKYITNISITFKQMNFTSPKFEKFNSSNFKSLVTSSQHSEITEKGKTQGKEPKRSIAKKFYLGEISLGNLFGF